MTLHETTSQIDGGPVIHQSAVALVRGDSLHDLACRAVQLFVGEVTGLLPKALAAPEPVKGIAPKTSGRLWTSEMWHH